MLPADASPTGKHRGFDAGLMEWAGDRHTVSAAPTVFTTEAFARTWEAMRRLPAVPRAEFFKVPGSTDVAVMINSKPVGVLTAAQFEELVAKLGEGR